MSNTSKHNHSFNNQLRDHDLVVTYLEINFLQVSKYPNVVGSEGLFNNISDRMRKLTQIKKNEEKHNHYVIETHNI